ncbi:hypothetical protein FJT64_019000 [Amphibalanus amphitrite]|uniref:Saposin B-type domain-containing protein n=1 Tax=Amphibalanus amphitrite TaxID=1232801 RepID=A0A6A4X196_AMPAM|nr:uncharacterized protein LOC122383292 [Amphibalanus amphitrite]XP_043228736.1 uncharacterized protein LOC122384946 [Amphibalanus amphitrite]KAF0309904.1 hypothetical protein FJT64_019000 [Amphibalanus amphitrite]
MARPAPTNAVRRSLPPRLPLLLLLVLSLLLNTVSGRRQLPETLRERDVFCETCYAVSTEMYEIVKTTSKGSLEQRIDKALSRVCSEQRLGRYAFPADRLRESCKDLIATFENELGLGLLAAFQPGKKPKSAATIKDICVTRMKACKKINAIPSLRPKKESSQASQPESASTSTSKKDRPDSPPEAAPAQSADRDVTGSESADQGSRSPTTEGKDEL